MKNDSTNKFLDTNVWVYATFADCPEYKRARQIVYGVLKQNIQGFVSTQVLAEYFSVVTDKRRFREPVSPRKARRLINFLVESGVVTVLNVTPDIASRAVALCSDLGLSGGRIYDALIAATMLESGLTDIVTADEKDFALFRGLTPVNPFRE